jgi:hypothetical protein
MRWFSLLLILLLCTCKSKGPACLIQVADIIKNSSGKLIIVRDAASKISALYDPGWDSLKGGAYLFYPNEVLKSYTFYQNRIPVYSENYDSAGYLIHSQGSPMVDRVINELGTDSVYVQVYFYRTLKSYQQLNIRINDWPPVSFYLVNDSTFSNMNSVTFGLNDSALKRINMYSQIEYTDDCNKVQHVLRDSVSLIKDEQGGLIAAPAK